MQHCTRPRVALPVFEALEELFAARDAGFGVDVAHVRLRCVARDAELLGNVVDLVPGRPEREHVCLALREARLAGEGAERVCRGA